MTGYGNCSTWIVGDIGYSSLTEEEKKEYELVGLYDQKYVQKIIEDYKLSLPYQERKKNPKPDDILDRPIFGGLVDGFKGLLKISGVKKLEDINTKIYIKTKDEIDDEEYLNDYKKRRKKDLLWIDSFVEPEVNVIALDNYMDGLSDEEKATWRYWETVKYADIFNDCIVETTEDQEFEVDLDKWESQKVHLNYDQLEKLFGGDFTDNMTGVYTKTLTFNSFSELHQFKSSTDSKLQINF